MPDYLNRIVFHKLRGGDVCSLFLILSVVFLFSHSAYAKTDKKAIRIVLSKPGAIYDRFATSLINNIHKKHPAQPVEVRVLGSMSLVDDVKSPPSLYIPVGTRATEEIVYLKSDVPMMAALVPAQSFELLKSGGSNDCISGRLCSAIFLDQPIERKLRLVKGLYNGNARTGIMGSAANMNVIERYKKSASIEGLSIHVEKIQNESDLVSSLEQLLKRVDVVVAVPDPVVFNPKTIKHILLTTYRYKKPLIAYAPGYVKAGALAAVYSSPEDVALDLSDWINTKWADRKKLPKPLMPRSYSIEINDWVAKSLGVNVPDINVLRRAVDREAGR